MDVQRADLGLAPGRMAPAGSLLEEHKLDGVLIGAKGGRLRSGLPPHHGTHAGCDAQHEGNERCGVTPPLGRDSLPRGGLSGATLEGLRRLLHAATLGIVHIQTIRTAGGLSQSAHWHDSADRGHVRTSAMMRPPLGKGVMMRQPTLFLTVGLPCTGKTTAARRIEVEQNALRLTKDDWVKALYGHENPPPAQDVIEGRLIEIGLRALELGNNVVVDYGLWDRDERSALRQAAADRGAKVEMRYFVATPAEQRRRLDQRQAEAPHTTWPMSDEELAEWAAKIDVPTPGELDGSEPLEDPPAGFPTWDEWRGHRWPPSVS